jgi:predicted ATPase
VQIFIESHSEHILRALQICVKKEELSNDDLNVLYFQSDGFDSKVIRVPVLRDGTIEEWPEGFFDQDDEDYKILFGF